MRVKTYIDTNILLDIVQDRPGRSDAVSIFNAAKIGIIDIYMSTQSILDAYYIANKGGKLGFTSYRRLIKTLRSFIRVQAIDDLDLCWAMEHHTGDFEDDAQWASAYNSVCDYFITRDNRMLAYNTSSCPMKVISPAAFVAAMEE